MYFQGILEHLIYKNYVLKEILKKGNKQKQNVRFKNNEYSTTTNYMSRVGEKK